MKILFITEFFPFSEKGEMRGGVEARAYYLAKNLVKLGHEVYVITSWEKGLKKEDYFSGIRVYRVGKVNYSQSGSVLQRFKFMRGAYKKAVSLGIGFDIVDGYNFTSYLPAYYAAKKMNAKSVATYHEVWAGQWLKKFGLYGLSGEIGERIVLAKKWDLFIAVSENTKKDLIKAGIKKPIKVVYNGIDLNEFNFNVKKDNSIICVARLVKNKRIDLLINAFKIIKKDYPEIKLKIIGVGPEEKNLKELAGNDKNIKFFGFVKNKKDVLKEIKKSRLFVLPSEQEGFGIATIEAVACNVPYIASDINVIKEVTENGKGGLLFKNGNYADLAEKIKSVLHGKYNKQGKELLKKYNWKDLAKKLEEDYKR